jgi:sugar phosphate permease
MEARRADRNAAWALSWVAYASYYFGRKGFSVVKSTLRHTLGLSERALGVIDTLYLAAYALGLFGSGFLGDRVGARRLIGFGLAASAACCLAFGASNAALAFGALFFVNGLAQSTGWPGTTRVVAEWTTPQNRGTVMAFWATCYQVGSIVASDVAALLLRHSGWRAAFYGPALIMLVVAALVLVFLKPGPTWSFGASYFFIKYVRYALLFWLPYYLSGTLGHKDDHAAYLSNAFEAGGIFGVIVIGVLSDRLRRLSRATVSLLALIGLGLALFACATLPKNDVLLTVLGLGLVGALLYGPDALLSGAAAQDVGGPAAASTATGLVNGVGSVGGMIEGLTLPALAAWLGWQAMFPLLGGLALCGALALVPAIRRAH